MGGRREEAEGLRGYFEVQLLFAQAMAERTSRPLPDTCLEVTNLHRRLGLGQPAGGGSEGWTRYGAGLDRCASPAQRVDWTVDFFVQAPPEQGARRRFGCFSYEMQDDETVVRIHFGNRDSEDGQGPLARAKVGRRMAELRDLFGHVRARYPQAQSVRGGSWLYNLEAYRRLFPAEYGASRFAPQRVRLDGTSSWGQLLDFRGAVKPGVRQALIDNLAHLDAAAPWTAFPLRALGAHGAIGSFYQFYGV
jgi:hypothetical protein